VVGLIVKDSINELRTRSDAYWDQAAGSPAGRERNPMLTAQAKPPAEARDIRPSDRATRLEAFAETLRQSATTLEKDIAAEETVAHKKDPNAFDYPMTARSMRGRLKNIRVSLQTIETEIAKCIVAGTIRAA
jgi:hypothetical protein